ncbi:Thiamine pyrophosphate enzyme, C-terminal TPP binding domain [Geosmithia morbida]|uniref:Thiamine pyrophosphate enzyme, C-terminal TPP binding domain n=1 Tax=Geosmithia morbida TaxID=1094350 RepID=A0A9P4YLW1_9HYPO|nr:Thiamine pyrophosphate enzyme, C-terminal TPP binding domain [Geosmithia morbida]KAF4119378.1 Thiamine pyrophosphate enzyme, C-terminal TPP binding domain [Geosmithia morbida]
MLREVCQSDTIYAIEAVADTGFVHDNLQLTAPGSWINRGGGGLGWSGGGSLGIKLAADAEAGRQDKGKFVAQTVGDGTYLPTVPGSVYWIPKRYKIPVLTMVLSNKDRVPNGLGSKATNKEINISFDPAPDYAGSALAAAAGDIEGLRVSQVNELEGVSKQAVSKVQAGKSAVVDCTVVADCQGRTKE